MTRASARRRGRREFVSRLASASAGRWIGQMALFGSIGTLRAQAPRTSGFDVAFAYIEELMRSDSPARKRLDALVRNGSEKTELAAGVFAIEQAYETKARPDGFFESHQRAIDVQVILEGEEVMEVVDVSRVTVREPFDPARDLVTYHDVPNASKLHLRAGEAAIFFPVDVHMPSLRITALPGLVRKTVVKVPVG